MEDEYLTVPEAAKRLKVSRQSIYNWIASGHLKAVRLAGKAVRIPVSSLLALMEPIQPREPIADEGESGNWEPALMAA